MLSNGIVKTTAPSGFLLKSKELANLPEEIIELILSYLSKEDFIKISCISRRFYRLATPMLYNAINLVWKSRTINGKWPCVPFDTKPPIHFLLRSMLRNDLKDLIEHISFSGQRPGLAWKPDEPCPLTSDELERARNIVPEAISAIDELGHATNVSFWEEELEKGNEDVLCALVLSQLRNLKSLHVGLNFQLSSYIADMFGNSLLASQLVTITNFQNLREVVYSRGMYISHRYYCLELYKILPLFYLPTISSLDISNIGCRSAEWPTIQPYASSIQTLIFRNSEMKEESLEMLLQTTPNLRSLEFWCYWDFATPVGTDPELQCHKLAQALGAVQHSLQHLVLGIDFHDSNIGDTGNLGFGVEGSISLKSFQQLTHVEIPLIILLGSFPEQASPLSDVLPSSITHLTLRYDLSNFLQYRWNGTMYEDGSLNDDDWVYNDIAAISEYLRDWRSHTPGLKKITIGWNQKCIFDDDPEMRDLREKLKDACEKARVDHAVKWIDWDCI